MANKKLRRLRRKAGGSTTAGRLTRAAALAGVIGGGGYLARRGRGNSGAPPVQPRTSAIGQPPAIRRRTSTGSVVLKPIASPRATSPPKPKPPAVTVQRKMLPSISEGGKRAKTQDIKREIRRGEKKLSIFDATISKRGTSSSERKFLSDRSANIQSSLAGARRAIGISPSQRRRTGRVLVTPPPSPDKGSRPRRRTEAFNTRTQGALMNRSARGSAKATIASVDKENSGRGGLISKANRPIKSRKNAVEVPKYRTQLEANRVKRNAAEKRLQSLPKAKPRGQRVRRGSTTPRRPPRRLG